MIGEKKVFSILHVSGRPIPPPFQPERFAMLVGEHQRKTRDNYAIARAVVTRSL